MALTLCHRDLTQVLLGIAYLAIVRDNLFHHTLHDYSSPAQVTTAADHVSHTVSGAANTIAVKVAARS